MKLSIKITIKIVIVLLIVSTLLNGQNLTEENSPPDTVFIMQKSPWGAVARSAVIPGLGQFYNESYWKIPVIWGVGALFISGWVYNNNLYKDYKDLFIETGNNTYLSYRDFYRDQRDNFTIYLVLLYILNLVDAYVDAHLYDFTVEEDFMTGSSRANFRFYF
ncbi:MAG: hypothetical protein A2W30_05485 [Ignavibacteria bacterium RBG_16_36_9]|nr:MAG: hypothetical protein A2W30_05485 [Ignavibacteria bacterium RBG_16_36_9]